MIVGNRTPRGVKLFVVRLIVGVKVTVGERVRVGLLLGVPVNVAVAVLVLVAVKVVVQVWPEASIQGKVVEVLVAVGAGGAAGLFLPGQPAKKTSVTVNKGQGKAGPQPS